VARVQNGKRIELQYADPLQNLMLVLGSEGGVTANLVYGPFGEVVKATGAANHRRQFNGKESDAMTGLRYYGARYYDPVTLRWNSADPLYALAPDLGLDQPQRLNLYSFSLNNPNRFYDPDGQDGDESTSSEPAPNGAEVCPEPEVNECTPGDGTEVDPVASKSTEDATTSESSQAPTAATDATAPPTTGIRVQIAPPKKNPLQPIKIEKVGDPIAKASTPEELGVFPDYPSAVPPRQGNPRSPAERGFEDASLRFGLFTGAVIYGISKDIVGTSQEAAVVYGAAANIVTTFGGGRAQAGIHWGGPIDHSAPKEPPRPAGASAWGAAPTPYRR